MNYEPIYELVRQIPRGKVTTYGLIATSLNLASPRIVGRALHLNPSSDHAPCHRVVNASGHLAPAYAFGGAGKQAQILKAEGIEVKDNRVKLGQYLWNPGLTLVKPDIV